MKTRRRPWREGYYELGVPVAATPPILPVFAKWTGTRWTEFSGGDFDNRAVTNAKKWIGTELVRWRGISSARGAKRLLTAANRQLRAW